MHPGAADLGPVTTALAIALALLCLGLGTAYAGGRDGSLLRSGPAPCVDPPVGNPEEYATLEIRGSEIVLTNVSDRPIVAWVLRSVACTKLGVGSVATTSFDHFTYPLYLDGHEDLLYPGESYTQAIDPTGGWIRPDLLGPDSGVYYDIGALVFDGPEAVGAPETIERVFEDRLQVARDALRARTAVRAGAGGLAELPASYLGLLDGAPDLSQAFLAIETSALEKYELTLENLRPQDLERLDGWEVER